MYALIEIGVFSAILTAMIQILVYADEILQNYTERFRKIALGLAGAAAIGLLPLLVKRIVDMPQDLLTCLSTVGAGGVVTIAVLLYFTPAPLSEGRIPSTGSEMNSAVPTDGSPALPLTKAELATLDSTVQEALVKVRQELQIRHYNLMNQTSNLGKNHE